MEEEVSAEGCGFWELAVEGEGGWDAEEASALKRS
jgi:hypothetical protein